VALARFVVPIDLAAVRYHVGGLLQLLGATQLPPTVVALVVAERVQAGTFAATAIGSWLLGRLLRRGRPPPLGLREAMALMAFAYLLFAAGGAIAFAGVAGPVDAFFEAMSGYTTTGLTVMDVEVLPDSLLFFRGYSQWIGGAGIIVLSLVVLTGPGSAGARLYSAELGQPNLLGNAIETGRVVVVIYAGLTVGGIAALWAAGAGLLDGLAHGLSMTSTGGFSPFADSFGAYASPAVAAVAGAFMVLGATALPLFYLGWRQGWRRVLQDAQLRTMVVVILGGTALLTAFEGGGLAALGSSGFHVTSAITTTGFVLEDAASWPDESRLVVVGLMAVGGSLGSTAGGLKLLRLLVLVRTVAWTVSSIMLPDEAKVSIKVQGAPVGTREVAQTLALVGAYGVLLFVCSVALAAAGVPMGDAVFEVASGLSTVGLSAGVTSPDLAAWAKLLLSFTMWAGRIEFLAVLVFLHPMNWLRR
jgi:trk system potassium uptake protein TrkH